jgi:DNA-binding MarR family transcriptional regulator
MPTRPSTRATSANRQDLTPASPAAPELPVRAWLSVVRAYHQCGELMHRRLAVLGVRTAEHELLINLQREPGLSQQAVAERCFTAKSHVSGLLNDLELRGWVRREPDPADARAKRLFLTAAGQRMAARTAAVQVEVVGLMTRDVPAAELQSILASMQAVSQRLQAALQSPA